MKLEKNRLLKTLRNLNKKYQHQFSLGLNEGVTITSRSGEVESIEHHKDLGLSVTVYNDYKKGTASTNNLSQESIDQTIIKAENISKNTQPDECQGLPDSAEDLLTSNNYSTPRSASRWDRSGRCGCIVTSAF